MCFFMFIRIKSGLSGQNCVVCFYLKVPEDSVGLVFYYKFEFFFYRRCNLYIDEKISIIYFRNRKLLLNERNELVFKCTHRGKFKLS